MIQLIDVGKTFSSKAGEVHALKNVNISVQDGDVFGVIGFSGAGKSTLIRLVNGLEKPTSGKVMVQDQDISRLSKGALRKARKEIGMVFQQFNLLNSKTVYDNVAMPFFLDKKPKKEVEERVLQLLEYVGLSDKANAYPNELSGGQKQRVGIARALAGKPKILLCDEATSALDPKTTKSILQLLKKSNEEFNITILIITHEMNVIRDICNKVAVMRKGLVVEQGDVVDVFGNPQKAVTKDFVKTVIDDSIPQGIMQQIQQNPSKSSIIKLKFVGNRGGESLLSTINKQFDVSTSILFATGSELKESILSILIVELVGSQSERDKVMDYIESTKVPYERVVL